MIARGVEHSDVYYMLGEVLRQSSSISEAIKYLLKALSYEVHSPYVYESLGQCYYKLCEYTKSKQLLKKFVTMRKSHFANCVLALCYYKCKDYNNCIKYCTEAISLKEDVCDYY